MKKINLKIVTATIFVTLFSLPAFASYIPFNTNVNMRLGIGTSSPGSNLSILGNESLGSYATNAAPAGGLIVSGNVGIGTVNPFGGGLIILPAATGNVGIGSLTPGQALDVNGIIRSTSGGFIFPDGSTQVVAASGGNSWSMSNGNVYTTTSTNNVGIGTTTPQTGLVVLNGNVGIGTWTATGGALIVKGGNVGIGTTNANQALTVNGTIYSTTGGIQFPDNTSQTTAAISSLWATQNSTDESLAGGNVGIGTIKTTTAALTVMNGNVGIGTWVPGSLLNIEGGNVGIGTNSPQTSLVSMGNVGIGTWTAAGGNLIVNGGGNVGIGTAWPGVALDVVGSIRASTVQTVNITSTPYTITSGQNGIYFTYTDAATGTINLPAISGLSNGFTVTIQRQVPQSLTIAANGADTFPNLLGSLEMRGQNIGTITLMKTGSFWNIVNQTADCIVGQACWHANMIFAGTLNGHQYFTTPGGCNNPITSCSGTDSLSFSYDSNGTDNNWDEFYGANNETYISGTSAIAYCLSANTSGYDGNSDKDWYLPSKMEFNLLYQNRATLPGFYHETSAATATWDYWSSTEYNSDAALAFTSNGLMTATTKTIAYSVRCVRRY